MLNNSEVGSLISAILSQYTLSPSGIHGVAHWCRVYNNAMLLCDVTGADNTVCGLFAFLHDACRENDGNDRFHGSRGALLAYRMREDGLLGHISGRKFDLLFRACRLHTKLRSESVELELRVCATADRLDIGRVGFQVDRSLLLVDVPDGLFEQASRNGTLNLTPEILSSFGFSERKSTSGHVEYSHCQGSCKVSI